MIVILLRLIRALFKALFFPLLALRRGRAAGKHGFVEIEVDGLLADVAPPTRFFAWRQRRVVSLFALGELADEIERDDRVKGVIVHLRDARSGMAMAQSLHRVLTRMRGGGRTVIVHLPNGADTKGVLVATAASQVIVGPQASMSPLGFAVHSQYVRGALDRIGVVPEILAHGKYKSAGDQLSRTSMSEPQREQLEAIVGQMHETVVEAIASGRGVSQEKASALIDGAPYLADEAVQARLADAVSYEDELPEPARAGRAVPAARYLASRRATRLGPIRAEACIGVIRVHGAITHSSGSTSGLAINAVASDKAVIGMVRAARKNRRIKGVVLHIDSPGGSALASDRMHHELVMLAKEKPLVACMANVAASGGYYVAAPAHSIVAMPTTITGSIGVIAARMALEPLLSRLGIVTEVVKRGARADLLGTPRALTEDERGALLREIDGVYRAFVGVVAEGRARSKGEIEAVAQGRVWTGKDAQKVGLVDELGGFERAMEIVRGRIGAGGAKLGPVVLTPPRKPMRPLDAPKAKAASLVEVLEPLAYLLPAGLPPLPVLALLAAPERALALCPLYLSPYVTPSSLFIDASSAGVNEY